MKTESTASAGQKETCHEDIYIYIYIYIERESSFLSGFRLWFWSAFPLVSSPQLHVWCVTSFRSSPINGSRNCRLSLLFFVHLSSLPRHVFGPTKFQTHHPFTSARWRSKDISISGSFRPAQKIWDLVFFWSLLIAVVIHLWLAALQQVILPESLRGLLTVPYIMSTFSSFFSLSQKFYLQLEPTIPRYTRRYLKPLS